MSDKNEHLPEITKRASFDPVWIISCVAITALAVILRFVYLGLKPFHHDEGVNGWFLTNLVREGVYKYDPENYHGPTLYYISLAFVNIFGLETVPVRWSVAIWGVLLVVLTFWLRRYIGTLGSLFAALFLALSPGMVFISRYFIHEIFFVFLALAVVVALLQFMHRENAGPFAIGWLSLILLVSFLPSTIRFASLSAEDGTSMHKALLGLFFIIEAVLVFLVVRMLVSWRNGRPIYLILAAASVSLIFATKETGFITLGTMLIAVLCVMIWERIANSKMISNKPLNRLLLIYGPPALLVVYKYQLVGDGFRWFFNDFVSSAHQDLGTRYMVVLLTACALAVLVAVNIRWLAGSAETNSHEAPKWEQFHQGMGHGIDLVLIYVTAALVFVYLWILFFSSFFTFPEGIGRSFEAYAIWTKTGTKDHTQNGPFGYVKWMFEIEAPILLLSALGLGISLLRSSNRFALFTGLWAFGLFVAYSIIPYKTPWLMLSFVLPMCISAGYAINELATSKEVWSRVAAAVLGIFACIILAMQTYDLNFIRYDDERMPYVYAHTNREFIDMVRDIETVADQSGKGKEAKIQVFSPDYWPLTWYLRDHENTAFHGRMTNADGAELIVAKKNAQEAEVTRSLGREYQLYGIYKLRPGVELMLLVRRDLGTGPTPEINDLSPKP